MISGGKDSCYNMCRCVDDGHEIVALANLYPVKSTETSSDEIDSFMYQTVGHQAITAFADALEKPLFRKSISGKPVNQEYDYNKPVDSDEVEDLYQLLVQIKNTGIQFEGISVGAIHSNYQRIRVQNICDRLNLTMLAYLWAADQEKLLQEMIDYGINAVLIKVAVIGLDKSHLGQSLKQVQDLLHSLAKKYGINVCGEGGEFETLTLDCPLFKRHRINIDEHEVILHSNDAFAPVYYLNPIKCSLVPK